MDAELLTLVILFAVLISVRPLCKAVRWYRENSTGGSLFTTQQGYGPK